MTRADIYKALSIVIREGSSIEVGDAPNKCKTNIIVYITICRITLSRAKHDIEEKQASSGIYQPLKISKISNHESIGMHSSVVRQVMSHNTIIVQSNSLEWTTAGYVGPLSIKVSFFMSNSSVLTPN